VGYKSIADNKGLPPFV